MERPATRTDPAVGESQSAFALTTYVDGVQPLTKAFDGFLVHSRGGAGLGLALPDARLALLYRSRDDYLDQYEKATDAAIEAGFVLADDRRALLADAQPGRITG